MKRIFTMLICICAFFALSVSAHAASSTSRAGKVSTNSTNLNVRSSAGTSSSVKTTLKKGSWVTLISKSGNFWKVEYANGKYGYCHEDYISAKASGNARYVSVTSGVLNVRSSAGTQYDIKATLKNGKCVVVLSTSDSWSRILYNGNQTGYVSNKYLSKTENTVYKSISLSVPYYKQTDSRWKNIAIGTSGDTIGTSGCTTTCLAMTESYRTGTALTPDKMAKKLTYAPAGWLYWPSNYNTALISSDDMLSTIYTRLKKSTPVIVGAKKQNGSQHWVVVTGYNASSSALSAENFTILDPGSSTRTTLAQFLSVYPIPYKVASEA